MPFHTRLADDDLHDLGFPKRSATIYIYIPIYFFIAAGGCFPFFCLQAGTCKLGLSRTGSPITVQLRNILCFSNELLVNLRNNFKVN
jgi:hypothetical protein